MTIIDNSRPMFLSAPNISTTHGFSTRCGGVSRGVFESLNLGTSRGDEPDCVRENYRRVKKELGIDRMTFNKQVHVDRIRTVGLSDAQEIYGPPSPEADGLITRDRGLALIVFTADCIPLLLHDPVAGAIGAIHSGWRSTALDIGPKAVKRMCAEFGSRPEDIQAAIGPAIDKCCFETGEDVRQAMLAVMGAGADLFIAPKGGGKYMTDLKGIVRSRLISAGLKAENISVSPLCTLCRRDLFWSHRAQGDARGSMASFIALKD
ncbi:MAG: peptidoglycan editing factor PgeF [Oscillospiraceae bacterium]|nr:peptidoglycan editing factor PgeF [Oscillospiraceae bacterium]